MKIAVTGDWHVFNFQDFSKTLMVEWSDETQRYTESDSENSKPMNSRLFNILNGICDMRDYCSQEGIGTLLIAGDIFHKRETIEVTVYNPTYKVLSTFRQHDIWVFAIAGNHDDVDNTQIPLTSLHPLQEIITVIERPQLINLRRNSFVEPIEVVALPYSKDKSFILENLKTLRNQCESPKDAILLCHLGITGGTVGSGQYSMKDEYSLKELMYDKFKYVVAGHYHQPQLLEYNSIYTGSPLQNNFGDELKGENGYNGFFVIDTSKRWDIRFVPIIAPRFVTVTPNELKKLDSSFIENNYIRVKSSVKDSTQVKDCLEKVVEDCNTELENLNIRLELEKDYVTEQRSEIGISNTFEETVEIYAQEKYEGNHSVDKIKELGLSILSEAMTGGK